MPATYEPIATTTLGSAANAITLSSIPSTYTDLRIVISNVVASTQDTIRFRVNGDTGTNYSNTSLGGDGTNTASVSNVNATSIRGVYLGAIGISTTTPAMLTVDIFSYAGSTYKTMLITSQTDKNGSTPAAVETFVGLWRSTAAINSFTTFLNAQNIVAGATVTIYGIKAA